MKTSELRATSSSLKNSSGNRSALQSERKSMVSDYAKCLIFPYDNAARIPTAYGLNSTLMRSKRVFDVSVPTTGDAAGRFAFFVQPKLGSPESPERFQIGRVNFGNGPPPDLGETNAYNEDDKSGSLAIDPNATWITQTGQRILRIHKPSSVNQTYPFNGSTPWTSNSRKVTYNFPYSITDYSDNTWTGSAISVAAGAYYFNLHSTSSDDFATGEPISVVVVSPGLPWRPVTAFNVGASGTVATYDGMVELAPNDKLMFSVNGPQDLSAIRLTMTPACSPGIAWSSAYGLTEQIRPVACSVLTTCVLPSLNNGGDIAAALYPSGSFDKLFGSERWDDIDVITSKGCQYHAGPLKDGAYVWWKPESLLQTQFMDVASHLDYEFPTIVVAGSATGVTGTAPVVVRVTVEFVYEIIHNTQLFEKKSVFGSTAMMEASIAAVAPLACCSENSKHHSFMSDLAKLLSAGSAYIPLAGMLM